MDRHLPEYGRALEQTLSRLSRQVRELQRARNAGGHTRRYFVDGPLPAPDGSNLSVASVRVDRGSWLVVASAHHHDVGATATQKFTMTVIPTDDTGGAFPSTIPSAHKAMPFTPNGAIDADGDLHIIDVATFDTPTNLRLVLAVLGAATEWSRVRLVAVPL